MCVSTKSKSRFYVPMAKKNFISHPMAVFDYIDGSSGNRSFLGRGMTVSTVTNTRSLGLSLYDSYDFRPRLSWIFEDNQRFSPAFLVIICFSAVRESFTCWLLSPHKGWKRGMAGRTSHTPVDSSVWRDTPLGINEH